MSKKLKVVDMFAGTKSISKRFELRGHETYAIEWDKSHANIDWYTDITKVNKEDIIERFGVPDVMWFSTPCFTGETLVLTDKGYKEIKDIKIGDCVLTHNNKYEMVTDIGVKPKNKIKKIKISTSEEINTTDNHPFYARTKKRIWNSKKRGWDRIYGSPKWVKAEDLTKEDYMVGFAINQNSKLPIWEGVEKIRSNQVNSYKYKENNLSKYFSNPDFWWLIGRYLGDGWYREDKKHSYVIICCSKNELNEITSVLDRLGKDFFNYNISEERTTYKIRICKKELVYYLKQFGKYAYGKRLTNDIIDLPKKFLKSFIDGYISADGYVNSKKNKETITVSSVSRELIHGIAQCIVKAYDLPVSITKFEKHGIDVIEDREVKVKDIYMLKFNTVSKKCYSFIEDGILWTNIKSIEDIYTNTYVYNMTVDKDNSYTANGVIVHNCEKFSVAAIGRHWIKGTNLPKTEDTQKALELLEHCVKLAKEMLEVNPNMIYFFENPRGKMRKMDCMQDFPRYTVTYCQYGDTRMKPTDIWTNHPYPKFKPCCKNGDPCHTPAPRGSQTGTQGIRGAKERSIIPSKLCEHIVDICEEHFNI